MNMQMHQGKIAGEVPNQSNSMMVGQSQRTGDLTANQMQNLGIHSSAMSMSPETVKCRGYMLTKIHEILARRRQPSQGMPDTKKIAEIARRLEDGLFKTATSLEEYMCPETLERRLQNLVKRLSMSNNNQQFSHATSSVSVGAMIPTPGFQQNENTSSAGTSAQRHIVSGSNAISSPSLESGGFLFNRNDPSQSIHGGHQQSSLNLSASIRGSNAMSSADMAAVTYQMIPTPGIRNSNTDPDAAANNETGQNLDLPRKAINPNIIAPQQFSGSGIRSLSRQKSFGGPISDGLEAVRNRMHVVNGMSSAASHLPVAVYESSSSHLHKRFGQFHPLEMRGDVQAASAVDSSGSGSLYTNQTGLYSTVHATMNLHSNDQLEERMFRSHYSAEGNPVQRLQNLHSLQHSQSPYEKHAHQLQLKKQLQSQVSKRHPLCQQQSPPNRVSEVKPDLERENVGALQSQAPESFQLCDLPNYASPPNTLDTCSTTQMESLEHMQQFLRPHCTSANPRSEYAGVVDSVQPEFSAETHQSNVSQNVIASEAALPENGVQDGCHSSSTGQGIEQRSIMFSAQSITSQSDPTRPEDPQKLNDTVCQPKPMVSEQQQFRNQQKWLLFLRHARRCPFKKGTCREKNCETVQKLLKHVETCNAVKCNYPRCTATKILINHNRSCRDLKCPVCVPVKLFLQARARASSIGEKHCPSESLISNLATQDKARPAAIIETVETQENLEPPSKRLRTHQECESLVPTGEKSCILLAKDSALKKDENAEPHSETSAPLNSEISKTKVEIPDIVGQSGPKNVKLETSDISMNDTKPPVLGVQKLIMTEKHLEEPKLESAQNASKGGKTEVKGVSMIELFTIEEVLQHIRGLRQWVGQSKAKAERNQAMVHSMTENSCQLCGLEKLSFEPPPVYCSYCGIRIKRNAMYYAAGTGETRHCFCIPCYNASRGDTIVFDGINIPKAKIGKKKNDEETEEGWVQCDKCEAWQHQICALFNGRKNDGGQAEYTCPNCYIQEVERGERTPLPRSTILGAKDLPRTSLSDHLEQRLYAKLKEERHERARIQGKRYDEVLSADDLVVRVVSSADKKLDVKPRFFEIFREENYPTDFPYKSKVVVLFQRIEGVEVFLFGMYVQEFGSECLQPNHRRVYLSYLDSVKYFRPDVKAASGEALRTYVYHEILIGYLESCKKRGFTSCYIWACPPLKGEDYIIYCHPEIQKTPKSDKLREWYLAMLRKAMKEDIVASLTNLHEHFFVSTGECKARVTAARLPYFDGDYWPGAAEEFIHQLQQEEDGKKPQKGSIKKSISKRALKASGQSNLSGNVSKDLLLMRKLGETISPMKEDFIMVHLQHACSHCCILMVSGNRWICRQCKNFQLCDKCHRAELKLEDRERHPVNLKDVHAFYPVEIVGIPDDTRDTEFVDSEIFDTRQAFLNLCQVNHYQYDTLRQAKHSSMMVLYHLHNPNAPAFVAQCAICHLDIESGHGWHCDTCQDYGVCNACYQKDGGRHPHKLINHQSNDQLACNKEAGQSRVLHQLRKMLDLLVHASQCSDPNCQYQNCRKVRSLFRHGMVCQVRAVGGCLLCKKMWYLLQLHSRACRESVCSVPRCRDMREHVRRQQQQSDTRRRAAVKEMMRQRAAEAAGNFC